MIRGKIDQNLIRQLADIMDEKGLTEIECQEGSHKLRLSKSTGAVAVAAPAATVAAPTTTAAAPSESAAPAAAEDFTNHPGAVTSPMVGTAYLAKEPGAAPYVKEGDTVTAGQTVAIVEAMKTFNPIPTPHGGVVKKILIEDGKPVEFGEPLMVIA